MRPVHSENSLRSNGEVDSSSKKETVGRLQNVNERFREEFNKLLEQGKGDEERINKLQHELVALHRGIKVLGMIN